jgi:hypothetical protein
MGKLILACADFELYPIKVRDDNKSIKAGQLKRIVWRGWRDCCPGKSVLAVNLFLLLCVKRAQSLVRFAADGHAPFT